jgi:hypothetical protein
MLKINAAATTAKIKFWILNPPPRLMRRRAFGGMGEFVVVELFICDCISRALLDIALGFILRAC